MASLDPKTQLNSVDSKLSATLHKIGEVYKSLLLKVGRSHGLSPIQVQILIFVTYHDQHSLRTVSHLAQELSLTRPTVSDAVKVMFQKKLIEKLTNEDTRSYSISLTRSGRSLVSELEKFDDPVLTALRQLDANTKSILLDASLGMLGNLVEKGIIGSQRMCVSCKHFVKNSSGHYCNLLKKALSKSDLRIDCEEFEIAMK